MADMDDAPARGAELPPDLLFLKRLVTVLTATMILGLLAIIAIFVTRLPAATPAAPALPEGIALPAGTRAEAVTMGRGWIAVVTEADEILILDAKTGAERQRVKIQPAP